MITMYMLNECLNQELYNTKERLTLEISLQLGRKSQVGKRVHQGQEAEKDTIRPSRDN